MVVGTSLQDRSDSLVQLAASLAIGGTVALGLLTFGAWMLVGSALRPVERMRQQAADISATDAARRLSVTAHAESAVVRWAQTSSCQYCRRSMDCLRTRQGTPVHAWKWCSPIGTPSTGSGSRAG